MVSAHAELGAKVRLVLALGRGAWLVYADLVGTDISAVRGEGGRGARWGDFMRGVSVIALAKGRNLARIGALQSRAIPMVGCHAKLPCLKPD